MPIIGLSDEQSRNDTPVSYPLLAKVKKGAEKPERGVGKNLPYFRFEWSDPLAETLFIKMFGEDVDSLPIVTLGATVDATFDTHYRMYTSNHSLQMMCDGCTVKKAANRDLVGQPCICDPAKRDDDTKMCNMKGYLYFTIPDLCMELGYVGQFVLGTGSVIEIAEMSSLLQTVQNTVGTLEYQRFILRRYERRFDIDLDKKGKNKNVLQYMVELVPPITNLLASQKPYASPTLEAPRNTPQLSAPLRVDKSTGEILDNAVPQSEQTIPDETVVKINTYLVKMVNVGLDELFHHARETLEGFEEIIDTYVYGGTHYDLCLVALQAICELDWSIKAVNFEWEEHKERHYMTFLHPDLKIYLFGRDPLRKANMRGAAIAAMKGKSLNLIKDMDFTVEELPTYTVSQHTEETGGHKYFQVREFFVPEITQETADIPLGAITEDDIYDGAADLDDIPF